MSDRNSLETDVAVLKHEVSQIGQLFTKLDNALDKLGDVASNITKLLAVHEEKIGMSERIDRELFELVEKRRVEMAEDIKEIHSRISTIQRELSDEITETEHKIISALDDLKKTLKETKTEHDTNNTSISNRLAELEKWRWVLLGGGTVIGLLLSKLNVIVDLIK
jgi:chromosome segregation ATPase